MGTYLDFVVRKEGEEESTRQRGESLMCEVKAAKERASNRWYGPLAPLAAEIQVTEQERAVAQDCPFCGTETRSQIEEEKGRID